MLTRRSMLAFLGLAPFAAKALANAKPEAPKPLTIVPPKGPVPDRFPGTTSEWRCSPVEPQASNVYVLGKATDFGVTFGVIDADHRSL